MAHANVIVGVCDYVFAAQVHARAARDDSLLGDGLVPAARLGARRARPVRGALHRAARSVAARGARHGYGVTYKASRENAFNIVATIGGC